ncbi:MAG: DUF5011 domain-containing protein, partial [Opitutae bacterium]|nr:DUF5011 domain-containing protein [Opitutae bacterium]
DITIEVKSDYTDGGADIADAVDTEIATRLVVINGVDNQKLGDYAVTYNATDVSGNKATEVKRTIHVTDTTVPFLKLLGDAEVTIEVKTAFIDDGVEVTDNYDTNVPVLTNNPLNPNVPGEYTITYNAKDSSGNEAVAVTRKVAVVDTTAPVITLVGDTEVTHEAGSDYTDAGATVVDNLDTDLQATVVNPVDKSKLGEYTVSYNITDANGNAAVEVTRKVTVVDTTDPVITLVGDAEVTIEVFSDYVDAGVTAADIVDGDVTAGIASASTLDNQKVGIYEVTYNVKDAHDNAAVQLKRIVNVVDTTAPVIQLIGASEVTIEKDTEYLDLGAIADDAYDGDLTASITVENNLISRLPGTYQVRYNVTDAAGNTAVEVIRTIKVNRGVIILVRGHDNADQSIAGLLEERDFTVQQLWIRDRDGGPDKYANELKNARLIVVSPYASRDDYSNADNIDKWNVIETPILLHASDVATNRAWKWFDTNNSENVDGSIVVEAPGDFVFNDTGLLKDGQIYITANNGTNYRVLRSTNNNGNGTLVSRRFTTRANEQYLTILRWEAGTRYYDNPGFLPDSALKLDQWYHVGPFTELVFDQNAGPEGETTFDPNKEYKHGDSSLFWSPKPEWSDGVVYNVFNAPSAANYLYRTITTDTARNLPLHLGSDDGIKVYLNGQVIHSNNVGRGVAPDQDQVLLTLREGENHLLMKIHNGGGPSGFYFQADTKNGAITAGDRLLFPMPGQGVAGLNEMGRQLYVNAVESLVPQLDGTPPALVLNGVSPSTVIKDSVFTDPGVTAIDEADGDLTTSVKTTGSVDTSTVGEYTLTYSVSDLSTNESIISRTVIVTADADTTPPVVTLLGNTTITLEAGTPFDDPGLIAGDDRDGDLTDVVYLDNALPRSGVVFHLDPSTLEGLSDGERLTEWKDKSANGLTFAASTTAPRFKAKGLRENPGVTFAGNEAMIFTGDAGISGQPALTTLIVARPTGSSARPYLKLGSVGAGAGQTMSFLQDSSIQYKNGEKLWSGDFNVGKGNVAVFQLDLAKGYSDGRHWLNSQEASTRNTILGNDFDSGTEGFVYKDDMLGTSQPNLAEGNHVQSGGFSGGALWTKVGAGGRRNTGPFSGGWAKDIILSEPFEIEVSLRFRITMGAGYENDEWGGAWFRVNNKLHGNA